MDIRNKFNYQIYDNVNNTWIFSDLSNKKYQFYFVYKTTKSNSQFPKYWKAFRYIILFFFFIFIGFFILNTDNSLYDKYYTTYQIKINIRSSVSNLPDSLKIAFEKFDNKKYNDAINILNRMKDKDINAYFYLGSLYQQTGAYEMAIIEYKEILNNSDNIYFIENQWYLGLCYLKINDYKNALEQFNNVSKFQSYYKSSAIELVEKLK